MSKKSRDFLFFIFIGVFLILTILISLYASGYKISLRWPLQFNRLLQKTGMLNVDTNPKGALIYLNDKPAQNRSLKILQQPRLTTPNKIRDLLPGEYVLRLEQSGYWPFEKIVSIYPGQTTFAEEINLFRNDRPLLVLSTDTETINISPNNKYLYLPEDQKIISLKDDLSESVSNADTQVPNPQAEWTWTDNGNKLLVAGRSFDLIKKNNLDYQALIGKGADLWQKDPNTGSLYYRHNDSLGRLEPDGRASQLILTDKRCLAYQVNGERLFCLTANGKKSILETYLIKDGTLERSIPLPASGQYQFKNDNPQFINLYDQENKTLYLIRPDASGQIERIISDIISWQWVNDRQLIYHNRWEIYWLDIDQAEAGLINRISEEITKILWNNENNYLVFSTPTKLGTIDLRNSYLTIIFQANKISPPELDQKNGRLYFPAQIGQLSGIYKMQLQ